MLSTMFKTSVQRDRASLKWSFWIPRTLHRPNANWIR